MEPLKDAVVVHNVWKSYSSWKGTCYVLNGINLTVPYGTIYGLLGPSGCGKTTLLRSIVGTIHINKGTILVLGHSPGSAKNHSKNCTVGYMPQDISLNGNLTIKESFQLYGAICGMTKSEILKKGKLLMELLGINHANKRIDMLSGGQKRRASLAIAMLHEPNLLILDEPTVGVDPVLRKKIWEYLLTCTLESTSIIITTHYIEEARMAANVGLMQNGKILTEGPPDDLMKRHNCVNLEKVFFKLCIEAESTASHDTTETTELDGPSNDKLYMPYKKRVRKDPAQQDECNKRTSILNNCIPKKWPMNSHRVKALLIKDIFFFLRHRGALGFVMLLPPCVMLLASLALGKPVTGVSIGVVNDDLQNLSSSFLQNIDSDVFLQKSYRDLTEAKTAMKKGSIWGFIYFHHNFSDAMKLRLQHGPLSDGYTLNDSSIEISLDLMSPTITHSIILQLSLGFQRFAQATLIGMDLNPNIANLPIKYEKRQVYGHLDMSFDEFLFPGFLICVVFFISMAVSALALIIEKHNGCLERMTISGLLTTELLIAHILALSLMALIQIIIVCIATFLIIGYSCQGSYALLLLLLLCQATCGLSLGLAISALTNDEVFAMILSIAVWCFMLFTQNFIWPTEGLPIIGRFLSRMMPQTYAIEAIRSIIHRGWGLLHYEILYGFGITLTWMCIFNLVTYVMVRRKE